MKIMGLEGNQQVSIKWVVYIRKRLDLEERNN